MVDRDVEKKEAPIIQEEMEQPLNSDVSSLVVNKKQRISRVTTRIHPASNASSEKAPATPLPPLAPVATSTTASPWLLPTIHPTSNSPHTASSSSPNTPEGWGTQDLPVDTWNQNISNIFENQQQKLASQTRVETPVPASQVERPKCTDKKPADLYQKPRMIKRRKEKYKSKIQNTVRVSEEEKDLKKEETSKLENSSCLDSQEGVRETCTASSDPPLSSEQPDYFIKYTPIVLHEQCQRYEADFSAEYDEYRRLHAWMQSVAEKFGKLDAQRKLLSPGSREYQILEEEILEEYHKLKQPSPSYYENKYRCEYLHNKLLHIKRLIREFEQRQAGSLH
ncbi:PREDICTED: RNA polymerase II elongation factor ELL2-like [Eurypyga helias]|uniref:RNA polymerase II elongation factor ELL2-like n=1 Tax=Eurypyga helias TaxID=54383 RepID=UPI0005287352|nr:PREDICTED: RNA polymerase II elongation factor ELL2-like [Eurypyga helias]